MDADAFVKKYSSLANYEADSIVASFIVVLSVIDRTILPRSITFSNGATSLKLAVAERKARLLDHSRHVEGSADGCAYLMRQLTSLCRRAPIRHTIRSMNRTNADGYRIAQLVNSQYPAPLSSTFDNAFAHMVSNRFSFDQKGWPVAMPADAPAGALDYAWRSNLQMRRWLENARKACGSNVLMITTSRENLAKIAVHASPTHTDLLPVNTTEMGQLISAWKASSDAE